MKSLELIIDDQVVRGQCLKINGVLWCHLNGRTHIIESSNMRAAKKTTQDAFSKEIVSPMPGKIIKVLVSPGQSIEAQHVVIVMEAMKMEYSLKAKAQHVIRKVLCQEGQTVQLGQTLVEFEDAKNE